MIMKLSSALAALAMAFTLTHATAAQAEEFDAQAFDLSEVLQPASDDIYADLSLQMYAHGRPDRPGRPGGPGPGGPGWGPPGGPGYERLVECRALNARGIPFYAAGRNMRQAQNEALDRCYRVSHRCYIYWCDRR